MKISEVKQILSEEVVSEEVLLELGKDSRAGVQKLLLQWEKKQAKIKYLYDNFKKMSIYEQELRKNGIQYIAGIDEVGRGPLIGPVVTAAVMLPEDFQLLGINDSKKLSEKKRDEYYEIIIRDAIGVAVGIASNEVIDSENIYQATKIAMQEAIDLLNIEPEHLLIDAMTLPNGIPQTSIIKGDSNSISIAAASIVAKVTRDKMMKELGVKHPEYGFEKHMGYGTKEHLEAIDKYGILPEHRRTFAPIKNMI